MGTVCDRLSRESITMSVVRLEAFKNSTVWIAACTASTLHGGRGRPRRSTAAVYSEVATPRRGQHTFEPKRLEQKWLEPKLSDFLLRGFLSLTDEDPKMIATQPFDQRTLALTTAQDGLNPTDRAERSAWILELTIRFLYRASLALKGFELVMDCICFC